MRAKRESKSIERESESKERESESKERDRVKRQRNIYIYIYNITLLTVMLNVEMHTMLIKTRMADSCY